MRTTVTLALLIITSACAPLIPRTDVDSSIEYGQEEELKPLFAQFEQQFGFSTKFIQAKFIDKPPTAIIAECKINKEPPKGNLIEFNRIRWNELSETSRLIVIYHELGHCLLMRYHREGQFVDGCPSSVMAPVKMSEKCWLTHKDELIIELPSIQGEINVK